MSWKELYEKRLTTAEKALLQIKDNQRVAIGLACAEPHYLVAEMMRMKEHFHNVELVQMLSLGPCEYCREEMRGHFHLNSIFVGSGTMDAVASGYADFTPVHFSKLPGLFEKRLPLDVALISVSKPDEKGRVSLGVSIDYTKAAAEKAKLVIAQVNDQMPFTSGDSYLYVEQIDCFVEHSAPLTEVRPAPITEVERKIGENCGKLIKNGDTLQLGIGSIPNAVLASLKHKKNLGIHTEMFSDGVMDLIKKGVINNSCKPIHKGKTVVSFLMGTRKLYDFVDKNEDILFYPVDYVNSPLVIAQTENIVSINSCVEVDLTGQIAAETIGYRQISGIGGQADFVRGTALAKNGLSIIAAPSTAANGKISRIVPILSEGAAVSTGRADVDCIITEYGTAYLKGKTLRQRGRALIKIAHPDFRSGLIEAFEKRFCCKYEEEAR